MKFGLRQREEPDVIITPLIDIVFLLLIFFMVSTTFQRDSALPIELPEATSQTIVKQEQPLEVVVDLAGSYFVDGTALADTNMFTLKEALATAAKTRTNPQLMILADGKAPYQSVITIMDVARQLGLVNLSFPTRLTEDAEP